MHVCVVAGGGKGEVLLNDELLEYRFDCDVDGDAWFRLLCRIFYYLVSLQSHKWNAIADNYSTFFKGFY